MNSLIVTTESRFSMSDHHTFFIYGILLTYTTYYILYINNFEMTVSVMDQMPQVLLQLKKSPESNNLSAISNNLLDNIQQIADSINGLVGVAKQSQTNQQIDFLHHHCKELEDMIGVLDGACVELELKILDESSKQKQVYKKALSKNMQELDDKKEELHENKCKLEKLIEETTLKKRNMPHFVDVTHLGIVNEEVCNASDSSDK